MRHSKPFAVTAFALLALSFPALADDHRFSFGDQNSLNPPGKVGTDQFLTIQSLKDGPDRSTRYEFKHEIEIGLTNWVQLGVDVAEWHFQTGDAHESARWDATAAELKFRFMDPEHDSFGIGLKEEISFGEEHIGLESKLILDKFFGQFFLDYNLKLEAEWERHNGGESEGELSQFFGASYQINERWLVGAEMIHEIPLPDWRTGGEQSLFLGPNVSFRGGDRGEAHEHYAPGEWALVVTPLFRLAGEEEAPQFQLRVLFEMEF